MGHPKPVSQLGVTPSPVDGTEFGIVVLRLHVCVCGGMGGRVDWQCAAVTSLSLRKMETESNMRNCLHVCSQVHCACCILQHDVGVGMQNRQLNVSQELWPVWQCWGTSCILLQLFAALSEHHHGMRL